MDFDFEEKVETLYCRSIFDSKKGGTGFPSQPHVSTSLSHKERDMIIDLGNDINKSRYAKLVPMKLNMNYIMEIANIGDIGIDVYKILPEILNLKINCTDHDEFLSIIDKSITVGITNSVESIQASGFEGDNDPGQSLKDNITFIKDLRNHNQYSHLRSMLLKEKILKMGVYLSGSAKMTTLTPKRKKYNKLCREFLGHWIEVSNDHHKVFICQLSDNTSFFVSSNWSIIKHYDKYTLNTRDHYIMIVDLLTQRNNGLLTSMTAEILKDETYLYPSEFEMILRYGDNILKSFGNESFLVLTDHEGHCISVLLEDEAEKIVSVDLYRNELRSSFVKNDINWDPEDAGDYFDDKINYLKSLKNKSVHKVSQAFGMQKLWGNPSIDPILSFEKLKSVTRRERMAPEELTIGSYCCIVEIFSIRYRNSNGKWPLMDLTKLSNDSYLSRVIRGNSSLNTSHVAYNKFDWTLIKFEKLFEVGNDMMISDLISDKTLSPLLNEIEANLINKKGIGEAQDRSVLVAFLQNVFQSVPDFLDKIEHEGFSSMEKAIALRVKELETKYYGRCFGMTTFGMRTYIVLTEALLKIHLIPYFKEITVSSSYIELTESIFKNTSNMSESNKDSKYSTVTVNMDFEKWNSNMRGSDTTLLFRFFSNIFGYENLFGRTTEMFNKTVYFLSSNTIGYTPEMFKNPKESISPPMYIGHLGGIEGLRQTGWTIKTLGDILYAIGSENVKINIMGQGDNQVLLMSYPNKLGLIRIKELHGRLINRLVTILSLSGPPIKVSETWMSSILFAYGKRILYKGTELNQSMKRLYKMYEISSEGLPTMETALSSLVANAMSATQCSTNGAIPFFLYSYRASEVLLNSSYWSYLGSNIPKIWGSITKYFEFEINSKVDINDKTSKRHTKVVFNYDSISCSNNEKQVFTKLIKNRSTSLIRAFLTVPPVLGGYPNLLYNQLMIKKFPDPLTEAYQSIKRIIKISRDLDFVTILKRAILPYKSPDVNFTRLMLDPVSLNIPSGKSPSDLLKGKVAEVIYTEKKFKNNQYKDLYLRCIEPVDDLANYLSTMEPLRPLVVYEIFQATPEGHSRQIVNQFSKTSVLTRLVVNSSEDNLIDSIIKGDDEFFCSTLFSMFSSTTNKLFDDIDCSVKMADKARRYTWRRDLEGLSTIHPFEFLIPYSHIDCGKIKNSGDGYIQCKVGNCKNLTIGHDMLKGPFTPNLGSITSEKFNYAQKKFIQSLPGLAGTSARISRFDFWVVPQDGNLSKLIRYIINLATDADLSSLTPKVQQVSGEVDHRLSTNALDRGGSIPTVFNLVTYHSISTESLILFRRKEDNYNIMFQSVFVGVGSSISSGLSVNPMDLSNKIFHFHPRDNRCCLKRLNESTSETKKYPYSFEKLIKPTKGNPFLFVPKEQIEGSKVASIRTFDALDINQALCDKPNTCYHELALQAAITPLFNRLITVGDGVSSDSHKSKYPLSGLVSIFSSSDPVDIFHLLAFYTLSTLMIQLIDRYDDSDSGDSIITSICSTLDKIPDENYSSLNPIYQIEGHRDRIASLLDGTIPATGSYWKVSDSINCSKIVIKKLVLKYLLNEEKFYYNNIVITPDTRVGTHPYIIISMVNMINNDGIDPIWVDYLKQIKSLLNKCYNKGYPLTLDFSHASESIEVMINLNITEDLLKMIRLLHQYYNILFIDCLYDKILKLFPNKQELITTDLMKPSDYAVFDKTYGKCFKVEKQPLLQTCSHVSKPFISIVLPFEKNKRGILGLDKFQTSRIRLDNTGAKYKILDILNSIKILKNTNVRNIAEFGGGSGNITHLLMSYFRNSKIYFNDFIQHSQIQVNMLPGSYPSALCGFPSERARLINIKSTYEGMSDFSDPGYPAWFSLNVPVDFDLLISDIEGSFSDPMKEITIIVNVLKICSSHKVKIAIVKSYFYSPEYFEEIIELLIEYCSVRIFRSAFSKPSGSEVYLILTNFKGNPCAIRSNMGTIFYRKSYYNLNLELILDTIKSMVYNHDHQIQISREFSNIITTSNKIGLLNNHILSLFAPLYALIKITIKKMRINNSESIIVIPMTIKQLVRDYSAPSELKIELTKGFNHVKFNSKIQLDASVQLITGLLWTSSDQEYEYILNNLSNMKMIYYRSLDLSIQIALFYKKTIFIHDSSVSRPIYIANHLNPAVLKKILALRIPFRDEYGDLFESRISRYRNLLYPIPNVFRTKDIDLVKNMSKNEIKYLSRVIPQSLTLASFLYECDPEFIKEVISLIFGVNNE